MSKKNALPKRKTVGATMKRHANKIVRPKRPPNLVIVTRGRRRGRDAESFPGKPGLNLKTKRPIIVSTARSIGRTRAVAVEGDRVVRLPTPTDELRQRGLRFILTMKSNAKPELIKPKLVDATDLAWEIEPLFRGAVEGDLERFLLATLKHISPRDLQLNPFDLGDALIAAAPADILHAEPDLPQNVYEPGQDSASPLRLRGARSGGGDDGTAPTELDWHLDLANVPAAWILAPKAGGATLGTGVRVGHPDTGYTRHDSFPSTTLDTGRDYDFVKDDDDAFDPMDYGGNPGHGTKTASVILGRGVTRDGQTVKGVAPAATLVPIRTIKSVIVLWNGDVARAIKHAVDQDCHVISMSLGGLGTGAIEAAVDLAVERDLIVLAAAGNQVSFVVAPANYARCIAVAACNINRAPWHASARGAAVAVTAPGENVWVARPAGVAEPQDELIAGSGTSFAVATLAGAAALWLSHHGRNNLLAHYAGKRKLQDVFREVVRSTAVPGPHWDTRNFGPGILDVAALLAAPLPEGETGSTRRTIKPPPAGSGVRTALERLATLFDDVPPTRVAKTVRTMVNEPSGAPDAKLERHATELLHILGTDPLARELFRESLQGTSTVRRFDSRSRHVAASRRSRTRELLADRASDNLARALLR